jgi:hypothetical protein
MIKVEINAQINEAAGLLLADGWHEVDEGSIRFVVWGYDQLAALEWTEQGAPGTPAEVFRCPVSSVLATRRPAP